MIELPPSNFKTRASTTIPPNDPPLVGYLGEVPQPTKPLYESVTLWLLAAIAWLPAVTQAAQAVWPEAVPVLEAIVPVLQALLAFIAAVRHIVVTAKALTFKGVVLRRS